MKTVGLIGGISPESTIEYYRFIVDAYRERKPDGSYPLIIINSISLQGLVNAVECGKVVEFLLPELHKLAKAGADFGAIAANTPHIVFDELQRQSPIPLISIVEATCDAAKSLGLTKVGLLGTRFTMQGRFYPDVFAKAGISLVVPDVKHHDYIHEKYMGELVKGIFLPETRAGLLAIVEELKQREGIQGLILGGTELPLILRDANHLGIPFLDTTRIHVDRIVEELLAR